jgi:DNA repair protein RadC
MNIKLSKQQKSKPIYQAEDVYAIMQQILKRENRYHRKQEHFWVIGVNNDRTIVFIELLALGASNRVAIKPPDAYRMAIYKLSDYVIFVHNHPFGNALKPSPADIDTTDMLIKTGELIHINVLDHFIINETGYYSFAAEGLMKQLRQSDTYKVLHKDEVELLQMQYHAAGEASGRAKGVEMGISVGKERGAEDKAKDIALAMLGKNYSIDDIAVLTGLSKVVVGKLGKPALAKTGGKKK